MIDWPRRLSINVIGAWLFFAIIAGYAYARSKDLLAGPGLTIFTPANGATVENSSLTIIGEAERVSHLYLNGRAIYTDQQGEFKEEVLLSPGYNTIQVAGVDRFNRRTAKTLELILK